MQVLKRPLINEQREAQLKQSRLSTSPGHNSLFCGKVTHTTQQEPEKGVSQIPMWTGMQPTARVDSVGKSFSPHLSHTAGIFHMYSIMVKL
jgi:hypothetical protein